MNWIANQIINYLLHVVVPFIPRTLTEYGTAWHPAGPHNSWNSSTTGLQLYAPPLFFFEGGVDATSRKSHGDFWEAACFHGEPLSIAMFQRKPRGEPPGSWKKNERRRSGTGSNPLVPWFHGEKNIMTNGYDSQWFPFAYMGVDSMY